jgi:hypothetical protein
MRASSRSPPSRPMPMTGWNVVGAMLKSGSDGKVAD